MQNVKTKRNGSTLTITVDLGKTLKPAGTEASNGKVRKNDLVATTGGFAYMEDGIGLSLNIVRPPAENSGA